MLRKSKREMVRGVVFQIDTGAECNVLPKNNYQEISRNYALQKLIPLQPVIVMHYGSKESALGQCQLVVKRRGAKHRLLFNVLRG